MTTHILEHSQKGIVKVRGRLYVEYGILVWDDKTGVVEWKRGLMTP